MPAALQVCHTQFDAVFLKLPPALRRRIEAKVDEMGLSLRSYPHHRLTGSDRYRLRVGDYRIIYTFDTSQNAIHLLAIGHRRKIYRGG
jgi:mRNA interferase RelE/StbE